MSEPAEFDIVIKKGAEFELPFVLEDSDGPMNLSTWSFKSQVRDPNGLLLLELYVVNVNLAAGSGKLWASASATAAITAANTDPRNPTRFAVGNWDFFAGPAASTATEDNCYMQGAAKIYPRYSIR